MSETERRHIQDVLREAAPYMDGCTGWGCWWNLARALGLKDDDPGACLNTLADRVDAQGVVEVTVPPSGDVVALPLDADGVPIHMGDRVWFHGACDRHEGEVEGIMLGIDGWIVTVDHDPTWSGVDVVHHCEPRTIKDVLGDAGDAAYSRDRVAELVREAYEIGRAAR